MRQTLIALAALASAVAAAGAQAETAETTEATQTTQTVQADPLQCWWRTTAGAVRVGETFGVVLTCGVLETPTDSVVVDRARLEPATFQLPPFEVVGGSHGADLQTADRRFFQYEYRVRFIGEGSFDRDVPLPETKISYRVQSSVGRNTSLQGRDHTYVMAPLSMRILSLVPADAADIRDATADAFSDLDARASRANLFSVVGTVLSILAALLAVLAVVRLATRLRKPAAAAAAPVSDAAILRGAGRELAAVRRAREDHGWSPALAGRALAAIRIGAAYALGRRPGCVSASSVGRVDEGVLMLNTGWRRRTRVAVSASITAGVVARAAAAPNAASDARRTELLASFEQALFALTVAQYGRDQVMRDGELDAALDAGARALRQVAAQHTWLKTRLAALRRRAPAVETRAWSR